MLRRRQNKNRGGQIFLEYTIVIGTVLGVLLAMNVMVKRGFQGMIKVVADQVGEQINAEQKFDESGHMERSYTTTRVSSDKLRREIAGVTNYSYGDSTFTCSVVLTNLGFQPL